MLEIKKIIYTILAIFVVSIFLGCVRGPEEPGAEIPEADGRALYNYITEENDYKNWRMWPGKSALYPGTEPHGVFLTTYVTDNAFSAIDGKMGSLPDGSIIIKENYNPDKELDSVTVMYKVKDFDPEHNDWFWLKYSSDGMIDAEGKVVGCIDCHGLGKDNDYLFTSDIK
ncbi:MAG: cytochrome P460 family protein [Candidatus Methanoperedens sp.]|nr:cytochrome P460 family protein [Candidatus Methanoperedens sp.]